MTRIEEYELGKKMLSEYVESMNKICEDLQTEIDRYNEDGVGSSEFEWFDSNKALKTIRTWNIIQNHASPCDRNLLCAFAACNNKLKPCLEMFNGAGKQIKNTQTLSQMITNARKNVKNKYDELYGKR